MLDIKKDNESAIDIIVYFTKMKDHKNENLFFEFHGDGKYLLGQIIRHYRIPEENYYVSVDAKILWDKITDDDLYSYYSTRTVEIKKENNLPHLPQYKGNNNKPESYKIDTKVGNKFIFRSVFHEEHPIPIKVIIEELYKLENPTRESVRNILNQIRLVYMLKEEDRRLPKTKDRTFNFDDVIKKIYKVQNIEVIKLK